MNDVRATLRVSFYSNRLEFLERRYQASKVGRWTLLSRLLNPVFATLVLTDSFMLYFSLPLVTNILALVINASFILNFILIGLRCLTCISG